MTVPAATTKRAVLNLTSTLEERSNSVFNNTYDKTSNTLTISVNSDTIPAYKHIWNIPVNTKDTCLERSVDVTDSSQPSNVTTLERISDLDLLETRLNDLKQLDHETKL